MGINVKDVLKVQKLSKDRNFMANVKRGVNAGKKANEVRILCIHVCFRYELLLKNLLELDVVNFNFGEGTESVEQELKELKELIRFYGLKKEVQKVKDKRK